jgi:cysteine-rich repeat protein
VSIKSFVDNSKFIKQSQDGFALNKKIFLEVHKMHKKNRAVIVLTLLICSAIFGGCGGGGGTAVTTTTVNVAGTVSAPSGIASLGRTSSRSASAQGLSSRAGVTVTMYYIDDTGLKKGNVLASATTDERGEYTLAIPADIEATSTLVVAVGGGNNIMRAIVVSRTGKITISPMSELVVSKICGHGKPLSSYKVKDIEDMENQVETDSANLDLSGSSSISAAVSTLYTGTVASNLDVAIAVASGSYCGDKVIDAGETCDDGNTTNGDGCSSVCSIEVVVQPVCGNGTKEGSEACDDGNTTTEACSYGQTSCTVCSSTCTSVAGAVSYCGDGSTNGSETCDDSNTTTEVCTYGQTSCTVCNATCASVAGTVTYCGDNVLNGTEGCDDGNTTNGDGCSSVCSIEVAQPVCGNGTREGSEACDDGNTTTEACAYGQTSCTVCSSTCASVAGATSYVGDGTINGTETCDDGNAVTEVCSYGQTSCTVCDATGQSVAGVTSYMGDGIINGSEVCDDGNAVTETCAYGQTSCTVCNSTGQSVAGAAAYCGDGITNGAETCDDSNTTTEVCAYGQTSCSVCNATCASVAGATAYCGDGTINGTESCDGVALAGATCTSQGFDGGTLSCSSCAFNTSACTTNPPAYVSQQYVDQCTLPDGIFGAATPRGMFIGGGRKYIADSNNSVVVVMDQSTCTPITTLEVPGYTPENGCISPDGTKIILTWGTSGQFSLFTFNSGTGIYTHVNEFGSVGSGLGQFIDTRQCVFDSSGTTVFIVDDGELGSGNHRVWKWDSDTQTFVTSFGGKGSAAGQFDRPWGITRDSFDNLFVMDLIGRIQKFDLNGVLNPTYSVGATLSSPTYLSVDSANRIYAVNSDGIIKVYDDTTGTQLGVVNNGGPIGGDIGAGIGIAVAPDDSVHAIDANPRVVKRYVLP